MKQFSTILILALVCSSIFGEEAKQEDLKCDLSTGSILSSVKNWLHLEQDDIKLSESDSPICKEEWSKYKTCCPAEKAKQFIESNTVERANAWKAYIKKGVNKVKEVNMIKKIKKVFEKINKHKDKFNKKKANKGKGRGCTLANYSDKAVETLTNFLEKYDGYYQKFKENGKKCFDQLKIFKANAVCVACSGRASTFQTIEESSVNNGMRNLRISKNSCKRLASGPCSHVYNYNFFLSQSVQLVQALRLNYGQAKKQGISCTNKFDKFRLTQLSSSLENCSKGAESCTDLGASIICKSLVQVGPSASEAEGYESTIENEAGEDTEAVGETLKDRRVLQNTYVFEGGLDVALEGSQGISQDTLFNQEVGVSLGEVVDVEGELAERAGLMVVGLFGLISAFLGML